MKAIIIKVSPIDASGQVGVAYDITSNQGKVLYPSQSFFGDPSDVVSTIQVKLQELTDAQNQASLVIVGQEITI